MSEISNLYAESEELKDEGKLDEAIAKLNQILEIDENHVLSHLALAVLYGRVNEHEDACKHGEKACELEPTEAFNFTAMSVTYVRAFQATQSETFKIKAEDAMAQAHAIQGTGGHGH